MSIVQNEVVELEPEAVAALVEQGEAVLVDVREDYEFAEERVPGAVSQPMSEIEPEAWPSFPGRKTVIMCLGGLRSVAVGKRLLRAGHPVALHLKGGLNAWKDAGLPTVG